MLTAAAIAVRRHDRSAGRRRAQPPSRAGRARGGGRARARTARPAAPRLRSSGGPSSAPSQSAPNQASPASSASTPSRRVRGSRAGERAGQDQTRGRPRSRPRARQGARRRRSSAGRRRDRRRRSQPTAQASATAAAARITASRGPAAMRMSAIGRFSHRETVASHSLLGGESCGPPRCARRRAAVRSSRVLSRGVRSMKVTTKRALTPVLVAALLGAVATGCGRDERWRRQGGRLERARPCCGSRRPTTPTSRMRASCATSPPGSRSSRTGRCACAWSGTPPGSRAAGYEARIAQLVREGEFELGWIGARSLGRAGSHRASRRCRRRSSLTDHALLGRVATGRSGARMLAGLDGRGFVGLALVPDRLRYPFGVRHPLASPEDFAGARVRVFPSRATDALDAGAGRHAGAHQRGRRRRCRGERARSTAPRPRSGPTQRTRARTS